MDWRYTSSSVIGTSHISSNTVCQDCSICKVVANSNSPQVLIAIASDGAGSARYSDRGSREICLFIEKKIIDFFETTKNLPDMNRNCIEQWILEYQDKMRLIADGEGLILRDFACTIVAGVIGEYDAVFFQIGDGAIVVSDATEPNEYAWVFWPERGEYENTTFFATEYEAAKNHLCYEYSKTQISEIAIFTDGIQRLALHYQSQTAYSPFFLPLFSYMRALCTGYSIETEEALIRYLGSDKVNSRTDDDKTLILATRYREWSNGNESL